MVSWEALTSPEHHQIWIKNKKGRVGRRHQNRVPTRQLQKSLPPLLLGGWSLLPELRDYSWVSTKINTGRRFTGSVLCKASIQIALFTVSQVPLSSFLCLLSLCYFGVSPRHSSLCLEMAPHGAQKVR